MKIILTKKEMNSIESINNAIINQLRKTELCINGKPSTVKIPEHITEESVIDFNYMYKGIAHIKIERDYIVFKINEELIVDTINISKDFIVTGFDIIRYAFNSIKLLIQTKMPRLITKWQVKKVTVEHIKTRHII